MPPAPQSAQPTVGSKRISADQGAFLRTMASLWPYMWPSGRPDLRWRVILAFALLVATKVVTLLVPYTLKWATDGLAAIGITVQLAIAIEKAKQFAANRHAEPDQGVFHRVPRVVTKSK